MLQAPSAVEFVVCWFGALVGVPTDRPVALPMLSLRLPRRSDPAAPPPAPLAAPSRAAELLTAAAAHRAFVEHCLRDQQKTGHQLAEMLEGWMTGEDATLRWHAGTCNPLAHAIRHTARGLGQGQLRGRTGTARGLGPVSSSVHRQELREQVESSRAPQAEGAQTTVGRGEGPQQGTEERVAQQVAVAEVSGPPLSEQPPAMETSQRGSASCCFKRSACEARLAGPEASASASASLLNGVTWEQMRLTLTLPLKLP